MSDDRVIRVQPPVWVLMAVVLLGGLFFVWGKTIETRDNAPTTISVSGEGRVFAAPDIAELSFGVQSGRKTTAKEALAVLEKQIQSSFDAVKKLGVEEKDIRTESFWLNPVYDWTQNQGQVFRGFEASQSLRVKVRDLDKVSDVLEAATAAGANQAGGVNFTIDEPEAKRSEARAEAIAQAKEKAQKMAADLGMRLGRIRGFSENGSGGYPTPMMMRAEAAMGMGGGADGDMAKQSIPLPAGEQEIVAVVSVMYELK
jgi:uncharacterized protein